MVVVVDSVEPPQIKFETSKIAGFDFGLKTFLTCSEGINRPRRKRTGYGKRFAPECQIRIASPRASPQSSGEYVPYSIQL